MDIDDETMVERQTTIMESVCITPNEYYGLVTAVAVLVVLLASVVLLSMLIYRYRLSTNFKLICKATWNFCKLLQKICLFGDHQEP